MNSNNTIQSTLDDSKHKRIVECPGCGDNSVKYSATLLSQLLDDVVGSDLSSDNLVGGKYCENSHCQWFKLDRKEADTDDGMDNGREGDDSIILTSGKRVSKFHPRVELNGSEAVFHAKDKCPECLGDVNIYLERHVYHSDEEEFDNDEVYQVVGEKCVNYGDAGDGCDFTNGSI